MLRTTPMVRRRQVLAKLCGVLTLAALLLEAVTMREPVDSGGRQPDFVNLSASLYSDADFAALAGGRRSSTSFPAPSSPTATAAALR